MRVLLINPSMGTYYKGSKVRPAITLSPPLNLALLGAALKEAGHEVVAWDLEAEPDLDLAHGFKALEPELVGITFRSPLFSEASRIAALARSLLPDALLVAGGVHATTCPEETLGAGFDIVVRGEGDHALVEIAGGRRPEEILGIHWAGGQTADRPDIQNIDTLPFPAWELFNLDHYRQASLVARQVPVADLESSRGCRAQCIYCTKGVFGSDYRPKSPARFVDEVEHAKAAGFASFNLVDDSFTTLTSRSIDICEELIRRRVDLPWTCTNGIRVANVNEAFFRVARRAGCRLIAFGFESGSDEVLKRIRKGATVRQAEAAVKWARKYDFTILGYFMVGLPGETPETIAETARFAASLDIDFAKFSITMPLPGTPLYDQWAPLLREGQHYDFSIHRTGNDLFEHPDFEWDTLNRLTRKAYQQFYGRPSYLARRLVRSVRNGQFRAESRYCVSLMLPTVQESFARR